MEKTKHIFIIVGRSLMILMAVLFILFGVTGIGSVWYGNRVATNVTLKLFSVVDVGVSVADTSVSQALTRVMDSRSEIAQTEEDITTLGQNLKENRPALTALSNRLDARLAPNVEKIQSVLDPVQESLASVNAVLSVANSIPYFQEKAPRLEDVQDALENITSLSADIIQLQTTIRAVAQGQADALTDETTTLMLRITGRIDDRLARTQGDLEDLHSNIHDLQDGIARKKARLLLLFNLGAALASLLFLWLIYSQVVVIRDQVRKLRGGGCPEGEIEALLGPEAPTASIAENSDIDAGPVTPAQPEPQPEPETEPLSGPATLSD